MPLYFVAIVAPEEINRQIKEWKQYMFDHFGCKVAMRSPAHVTLIPPFQLSADREKDILEALEYFASSRQKFEIALKDFSSFKPRVIYVDVILSERLELVKREVEAFVFEAGFPIEIETRPFHPHVTIANRDLKQEDFRAAWDHFRKMKYETVFVADAVSLLRKEPEGWVVVDKCPFQAGQPARNDEKAAGLEGD